MKEINPDGKTFAVDTLRRFSFPLKGIFLFQIGHFRVPKISHFQSEAWFKTFLVKVSFICMRIRNHFYSNSLALSLAFKQRLATTRKWRFTAVSSPHPPHTSQGTTRRERLSCLVASWLGGGLGVNEETADTSFI